MKLHYQNGIVNNQADELLQLERDSSWRSFSWLILGGGVGVGEENE